MKDREKDTITGFRYCKEVGSAAMNNLLDLVPFTICLVCFGLSNDNVSTSALILAKTFMGYFFGYLVGFQESLGIRCSVHYGNKNKKLFRENLYRIALIDLCMLSVSVVLVFVSKSMYKWIGIESSLIELIYLALLYCLPAKIVENINNLFKGILMAVGVFKPFTVMNGISFVLFTSTAFLLIVFCKLKLIGFAIALTIKMLFELCFLIFLLHKHLEKAYLKIPIFDRITNNILKELVFVLTISTSFYFEMFGYMFTTLFLSSLGNNDYILAWGFCFDICSYFFCFIQGTSSVIRTYVSLEVGRGDSVRYKEVRQNCVRFGFYLTVGVAITEAIISPLIIPLYTENKTVTELMGLIIFIHILGLPLEYVFSTYNMLTKVIGKERMQFLIIILIFIPVILLFLFLLVFVMKWNVIGTRIAADIAIFITTVLLVLCYNWNEKVFLKSNCCADEENTRKEVLYI